MAEEFPTPAQAFGPTAAAASKRKKPPRILRAPPKAPAKSAAKAETKISPAPSISPARRRPRRFEKCTAVLQRNSTQTEIYTALYYDMTRELRDLEIFSETPYSVDGRIFGGAPRDQQAGLPPEDIDVAIDLVAKEDELQVTNMLAQRLQKVRGVSRVAIIETPMAGGYQKYQLALTHVQLPQLVKVDIVFGLRPVLDFDVDGLVFTINEERRQLCAVPNPAFSYLSVEWGRLDGLIAHRQFHIVVDLGALEERAREVIRLRTEKMRGRGWVCLNLPPEW